MNPVTLLVPAAIAWGTVQDANMKMQAGQSPSSAWGGAIATQAAYTVMSMPVLAAVMGAPLVAAGTNQLMTAMERRNKDAFAARVPFSQSFRHTDVSLQMQMRGLQAIGASWAHSRMGSEAGNFARLYGR